MMCSQILSRMVFYIFFQWFRVNHYVAKDTFLAEGVMRMPENKQVKIY